MPEGGPARGAASREAGTLAAGAALLWASYYFFVLRARAQGAGDDPILAIPFLSGGIGYVAYLLVAGQAPELRRAVAKPSTYGRLALLVAMQSAVLVATYSVGAVDTSLLTLVADVVLTPILVVAVFREGRDRFETPLFALGIVVSTVGAGLSIVSGGATRGLSGADWGLALGLPFLIAAYFVWTAREGRRVPTASLLAPATVGAGLLCLALAPGLPGGVAAFGALSTETVLLLAINGLLSFFVGPWLYFRAIERAGLLLPSVLMATIPVFTLLLGVLLLANLPPLLGALGVPIAALGAYLAFRGETAVPAARRADGAPAPPA